MRGVADGGYDGARLDEFAATRWTPSRETASTATPLRMRIPCVVIFRSANADSASGIGGRMRVLQHGDANVLQIDAIIIWWWPVAVAALKRNCHVERPYQ
jgi:hypothetical protein